MFPSFCQNAPNTRLERIPNASVSFQKQACVILHSGSWQEFGWEEFKKLPSALSTKGILDQYSEVKGHTIWQKQNIKLASGVYYALPKCSLGSSSSKLRMSVSQAGGYTGVLPGDRVEQQCPFFNSGTFTRVSAPLQPPQLLSYLLNFRHFPYENLIIHKSVQFCQLAQVFHILLSNFLLKKEEGRFTHLLQGSSLPKLSPYSIFTCSLHLSTTLAVKRGFGTRESSLYSS